MKILKIHASYLSKTPFTNRPQNLEMVKVDCKRKKRKKTKSDLSNHVLILQVLTHIGTHLFQRLLVSVALYPLWQHSTTEWTLLSLISFPPTHEFGSKHLPRGSTGWKTSLGLRGAKSRYLHPQILVLAAVCIYLDQMMSFPFFPKLFIIIYF